MKILTQTFGPVQDLIPNNPRVIEKEERDINKVGIAFLTSLLKDYQKQEILLTEAFPEEE